MTRLNIVPTWELMDQHLFAEFREIKIVPKSLRRSIAARGVEGVLRMIPKVYTLNFGHVSFFYDKGVYLCKRYEAIKAELRTRGIRFNEGSLLDPDGIYQAHRQLNRDYIPTCVALAIVRQRIAEKIAMKPNWYRYRGVPNGQDVLALRRDGSHRHRMPLDQG